MTELLGIQYPIILAGMNWITDTKLVAAVSNAGGLGIFATARCTPNEMRENIREIRKLTSKPFGVNVILRPGPQEKIKVAKELIERIVADAKHTVMKQKGRFF